MIHLIVTQLKRTIVAPRQQRKQSNYTFARTWSITQPSNAFQAFQKSGVIGLNK